MGIKSIEMKVEQIRRDPKTNQQRVIALAEKMVADGTDVIINGCTIVAASFDKSRVPESLSEIPFIDSNVASLKTLEMLVDLHSKDGLTVSRKRNYVKPQEKEAAVYPKVRAMYGFSDDM